MKYLFILVVSLFTSASFAQVVSGEIKCKNVPNDGTNYDVHLQPDKNGTQHFKRCEPGSDSGLDCVVYLDSTCTVLAQQKTGGLTLTGSCTLAFPGSETELTVSFTPSQQDATRHTISLTSSTEPGTDYFGDSYFCFYLKAK
jgi:hypothetical protein